jgi:hypothetical protein
MAATLGFARLCAHEGDMERAFELAALVIHCSAGGYLDARVLAEDLCTELRVELPPEAATMAEAQGRERDLKATVQELLIEWRAGETNGEAKKDPLQSRLQQASAAVSARADHLSEEEIRELIERARTETDQET